MLYDYTNMLERYESAYQIGRAVESGQIFKVARGLYSDERYPSPNAVVCALYPQAVLTMDSAFYLHGLTDVAPSEVHVATPRNTTRIRMDGAKQYFMEPHLMDAGIVQRENDGNPVRVFSKERMLVELLRRSAAMSLDYYKELISSYRRIAEELDMREIEDCMALYSGADGLFEKLQMEVL